MLRTFFASAPLLIQHFGTRASVNFVSKFTPLSIAIFLRCFIFKPLI
jgi:hypothetical protein